MKIERGSSIRPTSGARSPRKAGSGKGKFSEVLGSDNDGEASGPSGVSASTSVSALLSIQEVPDALTDKEKAKRRAEDILDELEELRLGLLLGTIPVWRLERIETLIAQKREQIDDPRLLEILNEIEVRAAVELAKLGR